MITNAAVTLWHKSVDKASRMDVYQRTVFPAVSLQPDLITVLTEGGVKSANVLKIRIPTREEITVSNGDRLMIGVREETSPPAEADTVMAWADNRKGTKAMWHYKVVAG